jgi:predicted MarR family transcription regulator
MIYRTLLRIQLGFWLTVAWFEDRYRMWQMGRDIQGLKKKGLVTTKGRGKNMEYSLTPLGKEVAKLIPTRRDIRG